MGNTSTTPRSKKSKSSTVPHRTISKRSSFKALDKRESTSHLQAVKNKRASKGLSLKQVSIVAGREQRSKSSRASNKTRAKRGSIGIERKTNLNSIENGLEVNNNPDIATQDYEVCSHGVALHILHSTPSQVRRHLERLGAASGLGSDQGSDTESDFETDDEEGSKL